MSIHQWLYRQTLAVIDAEERAQREQPNASPEEHRRTVIEILTKRVRASALSMGSPDEDKLRGAEAIYEQGWNVLRSCRRCSGDGIPHEPGSPDHDGSDFDGGAVYLLRGEKRRLKGREKHRQDARLRRAVRRYLGLTYRSARDLRL